MEVLRQRKQDLKLLYYFILFEYFLKQLYAAIFLVVLYFWSSCWLIQQMLKNTVSV